MTSQEQIEFSLNVILENKESTLHNVLARMALYYDVVDKQTEVLFLSKQLPVGCSNTFDGTRREMWLRAYEHWINECDIYLEMWKGAASDALERKENTAEGLNCEDMDAIFIDMSEQRAICRRYYSIMRTRAERTLANGLSLFGDYIEPADGKPWKIKYGFHSFEPTQEQDGSTNLILDNIPTAYGQPEDAQRFRAYAWSFFARLELENMVPHILESRIISDLTSGEYSQRVNELTQPKAWMPESANNATVDYEYDSEDKNYGWRCTATFTIPDQEYASKIVSTQSAWSKRTAKELACRQIILDLTSDYALQVNHKGFPFSLVKTEDDDPDVFDVTTDSRKAGVAPQAGATQGVMLP